VLRPLKSAGTAPFAVLFIPETANGTDILTEKHV
jgi:hypothetical protein